MSKTGTVWLSLTVAVGAAIATATAQTSVQTSTPPDSPSLVQRADDITAGKLVQSPQGETIGTVKALVPEAPAHGLPDYVLVATETGTTAIPYGALDHLLRDAHLVIDRSLLADAPRVADAEVHDDTDTHWKEAADNYWQAYR
jgi:hypothetical protein